MVAEDFDLVKEIFSRISAGIFEDYDCFDFDVEVGEGYVDFGVILQKKRDQDKRCPC